MKTIYSIQEQRNCPPSPEHDSVDCFKCHELYTHSEYETLEKAQIELKKITDRYARIEKYQKEWTPPPTGRSYKEERFGWSIVDMEVIEEN